MSTTQPIRSIGDINKLKNYFLEKGEYRNYLFVVLGLNTALRACDILSLKWTDIFKSDGKRFRKYICVVEKKTSKDSEIYINRAVKKAVKRYISECGKQGDYVISNRYGEPLSRFQVYKILRHAGEECGIEGKVSSHALRKTFGYQAWKVGTAPAVLMHIYNHSSYSVTKRYLGIAQDDKDEVFKSLEL